MKWIKINYKPFIKCLLGRLTFSESFVVTHNTGVFHLFTYYRQFRYNISDALLTLLCIFPPGWIQSIDLRQINMIWNGYHFQSLRAFKVHIIVYFLLIFNSFSVGNKTSESDVQRCQIPTSKVSPRIFTHLKLWIASARHNFKWVKIVKGLSA